MPRKNTSKCSTSRARSTTETSKGDPTSWWCARSRPTSSRHNQYDWLSDAERCAASASRKTKNIRPLFTNMTKTDPKQIQPALENLHGKALEIRADEYRVEEDNQKLRGEIQRLEQLTRQMEVKLTSLLDEGVLKMTEAEVKLMHSLREETRKLGLLKRQRRKDLSDIKKSAEYLKLMESLIETEEKDEELEKMKAKYKELKEASTYRQLLSEQDQIKADTEAHTQSIEETAHGNEELRKLIDSANYVHYDFVESHHRQVEDEVKKLKNDKRVISKGGDESFAKIRDSATSIIESIYEASALLGLAVAKEVNDSYATVSASSGTQKPRVKTTFAQVPAKGQAVVAPSVKRNNFLIQGGRKATPVRGRDKSRPAASPAGEKKPISSPHKQVSLDNVAGKPKSQAAEEQDTSLSARRLVKQSSPAVVVDSARSERLADPLSLPSNKQLVRKLVIMLAASHLTPVAAARRITQAPDDNLAAKAAQVLQDLGGGMLPTELQSLFEQYAGYLAQEGSSRSQLGQKVCEALRLDRIGEKGYSPVLDSLRKVGRHSSQRFRDLGDIPEQLRQHHLQKSSISLLSLKEPLSGLGLSAEQVLHAQVEVYLHLHKKTFDVSFEDLKRLFGTAEEAKTKAEQPAQTHAKGVSDHLEGYNVDFDGARMRPGDTKQPDPVDDYDEYADEQPVKKKSPSKSELKAAPKPGPVPAPQPAKPKETPEDNYDDDPFLDEYAD